MVEIVAESRIESVQVYARGAQVTRRVHVATAAAGAGGTGELEVVVGGVTPLAEAGSLRAEVFGGRQVIALRSQLVVPAVPSAPGPSLARVRELELTVERLCGELAALDTRRRALLEIAWQPALDGRDRRLEPARRMADALAVAGLCGELAAEIEPRLRTLDDELVATRRQLDAARLAAAQATSGERAGPGHPTREVRVRLSGAAAAGFELALTYVVGAARWWPAYAARISEAGARAELELAAFVAQASGEDWTGVALALSTADLVADVRLPELASLRLSRRQPPARRGYRAPPPGLDALFELHDRAMAALPAAPAAPGARPRRPVRQTLVAKAPARRTRGLDDFSEVTGAGVTLHEEDADLATSTEMMAYPDAEAPEEPTETHRPYRGAPPQGLSLPAPSAAPSATPMAKMMSASFAGAPPPAQAERSKRSMMTGGAPGGGGGPPPPAPPLGYAAAAAAAIEPADAWLDFDSLELADGEPGAGRGRLRRAPESAAGVQRAQAAAQVDRVAAPPLTIDPRSSRGMFDHRYEARAGLDVPSDARVHRVPLARTAAPAQPRFVTVPREAAEVYREVALTNPFDAPLLPGPVDVYVEGVLLTTASLVEVGKGGQLALGLGVEDRLRVARNARAEEQSAGLLGGSVTIDHRVTIELRSSLGRAVTVDVIDRVPVTDDDDIEITQSGRPAPEVYEQVERGQPVRGGLRWRVPLAAGARAEVELSYRVKLAAKNEIVGGNRRE